MEEFARFADLGVANFIEQVSKTIVQKHEERLGIFFDWDDLDLFYLDAEVLDSNVPLLLRGCFQTKNIGATQNWRWNK